MFREFCEIFKNSFFTDHLQVTASEFTTYQQKNVSAETRNTFTGILHWTNSPILKQQIEWAQ